MSSNTVRPPRYSPLYPPLDQSQKDSKCFREFLQSLSVLCLILLACIPIAIGFTALFFHFYEENENAYTTTTLKSTTPPPTTTPPTTTPTTTTPTTTPTITTTRASEGPAASCGKRVVGYYTESENSEVTISKLEKLTHVIYLYAGVQVDGTIKLGNSRSKSRFLGLKLMKKIMKSGLKMMIGVGGIANTRQFAKVVTDSTKRSFLIGSIISFVDKHELDGVDIIWTWCNEANKGNYSKFVHDLRKALNNLKIKKNKSEEYLISVVLPNKVTYLEDGYYLNILLKDVDFLNVFTYGYDFIGDRIGPHSPLYGGTRGNIDETMKYLVCKTKQPSKINMAVPFYGTFWRNSSLPLSNDSDDIWKEKGYAKGSFAVRWRELIRDGWKIETAKFDEKSKTSYIWIPETKRFLTFDNERSIEEKAKYIKHHNLGGFLIWAIDQDDKKDTLLNVVSSADICSNKDKEVIEYLC